MQIKPITVIAVLSLVVASLLVAGCTTSTTSNTNQTSSATSSTETHNATLEKYITEDKNYTTSQSPFGNFTSYKITWINGTAASVEWTSVNKSENVTVALTYGSTYIIFPTTQDATNYLNAMNKTDYTLSSSNYSAGPYKTVTGHTPEVFKVYSKTEGTLGGSLYTLFGIRQEDNIIGVVTAKEVIT